MFIKFVFLLMICLLDGCMASGNNTNGDLNETFLMTMFERKPRAGLVSFEPLGQHIQLGLDFLLPFLKVPIVRQPDAFGNEPALININTAALVSTGLLASSSALVSYIFRRYKVFGRDESSTLKRTIADHDLGQELWSVLNNFKLVYTNSSGIRVDTSLIDLFHTIDGTFKKQDIDLWSCLQKSFCIRLQSSADRVNGVNSTAVDKIIDGLMGMKWLKDVLNRTSLKDVIDSNQQNHKLFCHTKFPQCKWFAPEDNLIDIVRNYMKFT